MTTIEWSALRALLLETESLPERREKFLGWLGSLFGPTFVLVGGGAVEKYSQGLYQTTDIDLIAREENQLKDLLLSIGFVREGKDFVNPELRLFVEFPSAILAEGQEGWRRAATVRTQLGDFLILSLEDVIVDRLNACQHWRSSEDCKWATFLMKKYHKQLDLAYLRQRTETEGVADELGRIIADN